jgi:hypothetical protein
MTFAKRTLSVVVAAAITLSAVSAASAFPAGPGGFANQQGGGGGGGAWPGNNNGPGGFANPQGGGGGGGGGNKFNPAFGIIMGVGAIAAAAAAASHDDDLVCWKEKYKGKIVTVCAED